MINIEEKFWQDQKNTEVKLYQTKKGNYLKAYYFQGISEEKALIVGGMHGSELAAVEVAENLIEQLQKSQNKPYFSVIILPRLFPDNIEKAEQAAREKIEPTEDIGRITNGQADPNRQFPNAGTDFDENQPFDSENREIERENQILLKIIQTFKPSRIANLHSIHNANNAGIYADPPTDIKSIATGFENDAQLALNMANTAKNNNVRVDGNSRSTKINEKARNFENAIYPFDPEVAEKGKPQIRSTQANNGTSLGTWGATATPTRSAITIITVEVATGYRINDMPEGKQREQRRLEILAHVNILQEIFLQKPIDNNK